MRPDDLLAEARTQTGLDDFGSDSFREGLAVYCRAAVSEAQLNDLGVLAVRGNIVANLANRAGRSVNRAGGWGRNRAEPAHLADATPDRGAPHDR